MNPVIHEIYEKILAYSRIMIFRHVRVDGDCVGATKGMKALIQATWPEKEVFIIDREASDRLRFLGPDDREVADEMYKNALAVVIDVGNRERISNPKYSLCREIIKIDHHIECDRYGDINWVEENRSSACEMIAAFYAALKDKLVLTPRAAECIFTGMVTDSGRFMNEGVCGETMRLAGLMIDAGFDVEKLYANLYLRDFEELKFKAAIYEGMQITPNGVAWIYVDKAMQEKFHLSFEAACNAVSSLSDIRGCLSWIAFIDAKDREIRVRLRSRFVAINEIAEKYRGGGHAMASGATVYNWEEMESLLKEADALIGCYKNTHDGWM